MEETATAAVKKKSGLFSTETYKSRGVHQIEEEEHVLQDIFHGQHLFCSWVFGFFSTQRALVVFVSTDGFQVVPPSNLRMLG